MIQKTYKRELAVGMVLVLMLMVMYTIIGSPPEIQVKLIEILTPFVFGFAALAFGMQWYSAQYNGGRKDD